MIKLTRPNGKRVLVNPNNITCIYVDDDLDVVIEFNNSDKITVAQNIPTIEDMILRDQFAMSTLCGLLLDENKGNFGKGDLAYLAYQYADEMLKQRKEK